MSEQIIINNNPLAVKEYGGQRVVTLKDIDMVHGRPDGTASRNFRKNKDRFIAGEDYFMVNQPDEIRRLGITRPQGGIPEKVIAVTESGYLMLVKSFTDDLAWSVQRQLVKSYFRAKRLESYLIDDPIKRAERWIEEQKERMALQSMVNVQAKQIEEMKPKAAYYDIVLNCPDVVSVNTIAKDYGKSAVWLNNWLHEHGVQYKQGKLWHLYQKYAKNSYTKTKTISYGSNDDKHCRSHTYWTQKGRLFIYELLKENGILPLIEQEGGKK